MAEKRITIEIVADEKGAVTSLRHVGDELDRTSSRARDADSGFSTFGARLVTLNQALDLTGRALGGARLAVDGLLAGINRADQLDELSQKLGINVELLSSLELAAKTGGLSLESLGSGVKVIARNLAEAAGGNKDLAASFAAVGVDAKAGLNDIPGTLVKIADAFARAEDGGAKTAFAMQIAGRAGAEMIPFFNQGGTEIARLVELSGKLGTTLQGETAAGAGAFNDNLDIMLHALTGVQSQLAAGMVPGLRALTDELVALVAEAGVGNGAIREFGAVLGDGLKAAFDEARATLEDAQSLIADVGWEEATTILGQRLEDALAAALERAIWAAAGAAKNVAVTAIKSIFSEIDVTEAVASSNEKILQEILARKQSLLRQAQLPGVPLEQQDSSVRDLVADVDALNGRLGELAGQRLVAEAASAKHAQATQEEQANLSLLTLGLDQGGESWRFYEQGAGSLARTTLPAVGAAASAASTLLQSLTAEAAKVGATNAIWAQAAAGTITYQEAVVRVAAAQKVAGQEGATLTAQLLAEKTARDAVAGSLNQGIAQQLAQVDAVQAGIDAFEQAFAATGDVAEATARAALAQEQYTARALGAAAGNEQLGETAAETAARVAELTQRLQDKQQAAQNDAQLAILREQLTIHQQLAAGIHTQAEAERALAVAAAGVNPVLRDQAGAVHDIQQQIEDTKRGFINLGEVVRGAFSEVGAALVADTRKLGDALEGIAISIGTKWWDAILEDKLSFDNNVKANFLDLGSFGEGVFGKMFSGAADWVGSLFRGGSGGVNLSGLTGGFSSEGAGYGFSDAGGGFGVGDAAGAGKGLLDMLFGGGGGSGSVIGGAAIGALGGFGTSRMLGDLLYKPGATGLNGLAQRGAEGGFLSYASGANQIGGAIIGAILSAFVGPLGGVLGGAISSAFGSLVLNAIDRDALRSGRLSGPLGDDWMNAFVLPGALGSMMNAIMPIPTLGTAFRRGGESIIDSSRIFGGEDGTGGLQGLLGDWTRVEHANGRQLAMERGFTAGQVDLVEGGAGGLFNFLAKGEDHIEDAGRFGLEMGRTMAAFLARGVEEGMTFEELFGSLRGFADEADITLMGAIGNLPALMASVTAQAQVFGKVDPAAAAQEGAAAYAQSLLGISAIFQGDFPAGVNVAAIALSTLEKDGVKAFGEITRSTDDWLRLLADSPEEFQRQVEKLAGDGFGIDVAEFENRLQDITASATFLGENLAGVFSYENIGQGVDALAASLRSLVTEQVFTTGMGQLFDASGIASSFEPVFALLRQIDQFDLTTATGAASFRDQIVAAIAAGKANLEEYIPQLEAIAEATKLVDEAIEEATKPSDLEVFYDWLADVSARADQLLGGAIRSAWTEGLNVIREGGSTEEALAVFREQLRLSVGEAILNGIIEAFIQSAVIEGVLAPWMAQIEALFKDGIQEGDLDLAKSLLDGGMRAVEQLFPIFEDFFVWAGDRAREIFDGTPTGVSIDPRTGEPTYSDVGGRRSGIGRAAHGGFFSDAAIVGEAGYPELVQAVDGGFHVTPLTWDVARALMGAGAPGYARGGFGGGATGFGSRGISRSPGDSYGGGVGGGRGPVLNPTGNPGDLGGRGESERGATAEPGYFNLDASGLLVDFASGAIVDLGAVLQETSRDALLSGIVEALLSRGPLASAIARYQHELEVATAKAMSDGVLSVDEAGTLAQIAERAKAEIGAQITALGPVFDALGVRIPKAVEAAAPLVRDILGSTIEQAFAEGQTFEQFAQGARLTLFEHIRGGLVDAFIDSAIVQGLLAGPLAAIQGIFVQIGQGQLTVAEANALLLTQTAAINGLLDDPAFKATWEATMEMLNGIRDSIGVQVPLQIAAGLDPVIDRGQTVINQAKDICGAKCQLEKEIIDYGLTAGDDAGNLGRTLVERYIPREGPAPDLNTYAGFLRFAQQDGVVDPAERARLAELYMQERRIPNFDIGGIAVGPSSGYLARLHGREMVLSDPRAFDLGDRRPRGDDVTDLLREIIRGQQRLERAFERYAGSQPGGMRARDRLRADYDVSQVRRNARGADV